MFRSACCTTKQKGEISAKYIRYRGDYSHAIISTCEGRFDGTSVVGIDDALDTGVGTWTEQEDASN